MTDNKPKPSSPPRVRVPRPDELTKDTLEFIAAVDEYKRTHMISIVTLEQVLEVLGGLGYQHGKGKRREVDVLDKAVEGYKSENKRLFPNWSEIFKVALDLGYSRNDRVA